MTTEQNQPQPQSIQGQPAPGRTQGHRRRRRRRKAYTNGQNKGPVNEGVQQAPPPGITARSKPHPKKFISKKGHGNGGGQPGGRQKKQKRPQTFIGPMDHSYRVMNGNLADGPPSTIEYRSNGHNGFYPDASPVEPSVSPVRENAPTRIFCFIEDLFFLAKIQETARKVGVKVGFVKADKDIVSRLADVPEGERPSLIVFDLNNAGAKPLTLIPRIKSKLKRGTSVIGFLSHLQGDLKAKALEAGCDMVMPRSAFSQNLPNLLRRHGLEEELEPIEA